VIGEMNKQAIKKIITREGLVLLFILLLSVFFGHTGHEFFWTKIAPQIDPAVYFVYPTQTLKGAILANFVNLYIIYLSIWLVIFILRFIIWAVRTLKEK